MIGNPGVHSLSDEAVEILAAMDLSQDVISRLLSGKLGGGDCVKNRQNFPPGSRWL